MADLNAVFFNSFLIKFPIWSMPSVFTYYVTFLRKMGIKRGKFEKINFFIFHQIFVQFFLFCSFECVEYACYKKISFRTKKGAQRGQYFQILQILYLSKIFIFWPIFTGIFSLNSLWRGLSGVCQRICSIYYGFWVKRGRNQCLCQRGQLVEFLLMIRF